jgi:soluble lytic murein transglycosylase
MGGGLQAGKAEGRRVFFFVNKKEAKKNFINLDLARFNTCGPKPIKVFWFFFSKKNFLLPSFLPLACKQRRVYKEGMKLLVLAAALILPSAALAQHAASPQIMIEVKAGDWPDAQNLAAATGDPLMVKLVTYFKLLAPGGGSAADIQAFIDANPDWPQQGLLALRARQAAGLPPVSTAPEDIAFLDQVEALHAAGQDEQAATLWETQGQAMETAADPAGQTQFWPDQNQLARALLTAGDAKSAYAVVTAAAPPDANLAATSQTADRDFLAGFIALRFLHQPAVASGWFMSLASASTAVITQARAYYWLGRTQTGAQAAADYARAAQYPNTYYGQLAALALGDTPTALANRILAVGEPSFSANDALNFAVMELPRAAALLVQMNDPHDAQIFLNRLGQTAADDRTRALAARLAIGLNLPESAVSIARTAGLNGQMLVREGWPTPVTPPNTIDPAISLGLIRQESSFDPTAISTANAVGLMQLLPSTARKTGKDNGLPYNNLTNPSQNMALGTAYFATVIQNFGNCLPLAIGAYNAGPTNVARWLTANGDPELGNNPGSANIIDWIELIPFNETRNYVQRVSENITIYEALTGNPATPPVAPWLPH